MNAVGFYVHIPFCQHKCIYCDFNSYPGQAALFTPYLSAVRQEMAIVAPLLANVRPPSCTLYVGGGTPTLLPAPDLGALIETLRHIFSLADDAETTVEANPGTVDVDGLRCLRASGVNRLSLGVQSFDDRLLRTLGRIHTARGAQEAIRDARLAGFTNLNLDLILGLPGQTLQNWQESVQAALDASPPHLSLYALTVEEGTPLAASIAGGSLPAPDQDLAADMYEWAAETLERAGYVHYEISNWALPGYACQHNLLYWHNEPYIGLGAGAHSWWAGRRWANLRLPAAYIAALDAGQPLVAEQETVGRAQEISETMIMGLRLLEEGVSFARFEARFGVSMHDVYAAEIAGLVARGLLERTADHIRLTRRGHLLGNQAFAQFLPD